VITRIINGQSKYRVSCWLLATKSFNRFVSVCALLTLTMVMTGSAVDLAITGVLHHRILDVGLPIPSTDNHAAFSVATTSNAFWTSMKFENGSTLANPILESDNLLCATGKCFHLSLFKPSADHQFLNKGNLEVYNRLFPAPAVTKEAWLWLAYASLPSLEKLPYSKSTTQVNVISNQCLPFAEHGMSKTGQETSLDTVFEIGSGLPVAPNNLVQFIKFGFPPGVKALTHSGIPLFHTNLTFSVQATTNLSGMMVPTAWRLERWMCDPKEVLKGNYVPRLFEVGIVTNANVSIKQFSSHLNIESDIYTVTDHTVEPRTPGSRPAVYMSSNGLLPRVESERLAGAATKAHQAKLEQLSAGKRRGVAFTTLLVIFLPLLLTGAIYFAYMRSIKQTTKTTK
jgi:hypothetical protein